MTSEAKDYSKEIILSIYYLIVGSIKDSEGKYDNLSIMCDAGGLKKKLDELDKLSGKDVDAHVFELVKKDEKIVWISHREKSIIKKFNQQS